MSSYAYVTQLLICIVVLKSKIFTWEGGELAYSIFAAPYSYCVYPTQPLSQGRFGWLSTADPKKFHTYKMEGPLKLTINGYYKSQFHIKAGAIIEILL